MEKMEEIPAPIPLKRSNKIKSQKVSKYSLATPVQYNNDNLKRERGIKTKTMSDAIEGKIIY